jgi:tetratricopeptide (TPR) repeat protein
MVPYSTNNNSILQGQRWGRVIGNGAEVDPQEEALVEDSEETADTQAESDTSLDSFVEKIQTVDNGLELIVSITLNGLLLLLGALVTGRLLYLIFRRTPELLIEVPKNSTREEIFDNYLAGFTSLFKEELIREIEYIKGRFSKYESYLDIEQESIFEPKRISEKIFSLRGREEQEVNSLITSLQSSGSDRVNAALTTLSVLIPISRIRVISVLQELAELKAQTKVSVTFEIRNSRRDEKPNILTIHRAVSVVSADASEGEQEKQELLIKDTLRRKYIEIFELAASWLSVELLGKQLAFSCKFYGFRDNQIRKSRIYNIMGELFTSKGGTAKDHSFFFDLAVGKFKEAITLDKNWYKSYLNLGDLHVIKGMEEKARSEYKKALEILKTNNRIKKQKLIELRRRTIKYIIELKILRLDILSKKYSTDSELLKNIQNFDRDIVNHMNKINNYVVNTCQFSENSNEEVRNSLSLDIAKLAYDLACIFSLVYSDIIKSNIFNLNQVKGSLTGNESILYISREFLVLALLNNFDFWHEANRDSDLENVNNGMTKFKNRVLLEHEIIQQTSELISVERIRSVYNDIFA